MDNGFIRIIYITACIFAVSLFSTIFYACNVEENGGELNCEWFENENCWKQTLSEIKSCLPGSITGYLSNDGTQCTFSDGTTITFNNSINVNRIQSAAYNLEWDFIITRNELPCISYQEFENGSMKLTVSERTFSLDYSGTSLSITCPDESNFYMNDFMSLSTDCISDIPNRDITVSSDLGQASITFKLTGGADDEVTVFSCITED